MSSTQASKHLAFSCVMLFITLTCSLILSEILLRITGVVSARSVHSASEDVFPLIPGIFEPGQALTVDVIPQLTHRISINSLGYRGRAISLTKHPETFRILCIGDSFTFGDKVNDDATWPYYLERLMEQQHINAEVINAGVAGTTIDDQLYFLKRSIVLSPDMVILMFSENDIDNLGEPEPYYVTLEKQRRVKSLPIVRNVYHWVRDTALFHFALYVRKWLDMVSQKNGNGRDAAHHQRLWRRYQKLLSEMKTYLEGLGIQFVFTIFPSNYRFQEQVNHNTVYPHLDRIELATRRMGIDTINLMEPLRQTKMTRDELYLLPYDGHPSGLAYARAGEAIFEFLQQRHGDNLIGYTH